MSTDNKTINQKMSVAQESLDKLTKTYTDILAEQMSVVEIYMEVIKQAKTTAKKSLYKKKYSKIKKEINKTVSSYKNQEKLLTSLIAQYETEISEKDNV